ncbi:uncharacterized protein V6R79_002069 [Siganus canaliculatus]
MMKRMAPIVEVLEDNDSDSYSEDDNDDNTDNQQPAKRPTEPRKPAARPTTWHKCDLDNEALPEYQHTASSNYTETKLYYFTRYYSPELIRHIIHQTNLYTAQKDINTTFTTTEDEMMIFVAILIYMGIVPISSTEDYWAMETRVPQVANLMSSKRFRLLKRVVHINDNAKIPEH